MIRLVNRGTGDVLGTIQEADLEVLRKALEEEGEDDRDYYVVEETVETLVEQGLTSEAQSLLHNGLSKDGDLEFGWERVLDYPSHQIEGRLLWTPSERPAVGVQVEVCEHRGMLRDALVAWAFSRADGTFEIACTDDDLEDGSKLRLGVVDKVRGVLLNLPLQNPLARYVKVGEQRLQEMFVPE